MLFAIGGFLLVLRRWHVLGLLSLVRGVSYFVLASTIGGTGAFSLPGRFTVTLVPLLAIPLALVLQSGRMIQLVSSRCSCCHWLSQSYRYRISVSCTPLDSTTCIFLSSLECEPFGLTSRPICRMDFSGRRQSQRGRSVMLNLALTLRTVSLLRPSAMVQAHLYLSISDHSSREVPLLFPDPRY
jgi:hypothetical protein